MRLNKIARPALLAALIAASGTASAVTWDFQTSPPANHLWGVSQSFDTNPTSGNLIFAYGYDSAGLRTDLFSKFSGAGSDETGLGLNIDPDGDHEITPGASIVFGGAAMVALGRTFTIEIGSLQGSGMLAENADINECKDTGCSLKNFLANVSGPPTQKSITLTLDSGYSYFQVFDKPCANPKFAGCGGADVLLDSVSAASSVPEPATLGLLGLGLAGLGFMRRRKAS